MDSITYGYSLVMNIQQCRYLVAVEGHSCNLTEAAKSLFTSQPGISKQLKLLEEEVGATLLVRRRNRIVGLTPAGEVAVTIAKRILRDVERLRLLGRDFSESPSGTLTVAATHVQARYVLLPLVRKFKQAFPEVDIRLMQCNPDQVASLVSSGVADFGVSISPAASPTTDLVRLPCYQTGRFIITPKGHDLTKLSRVTLKDLARYPLVSLDSSFSAGVSVLSSMEAAGLSPKVVMSATDAGIIKAYVEAGLGVATIPSIAFDSARDTELASIDAQHLFPPSVVSIWIHRDAFVSHNTQAFIQMIAPQWDAAAIDTVLQVGPEEDELALAEVSKLPRKAT
ncbi:LysR substrate-binding domain-containing protein [Cupriavidus sp. 8B]